MYMNLHNLPPGHSMFTLHIAPAGTPVGQTEEFDLVTHSQPPENRYLASMVIEAAREALVADYGDTVQVYAIVDQSAGDNIFDSTNKGYIPIPVVPPTRLAETTEHPYDMLLALAADERDGLGGAEYRDWLLEVGE